MTDTTLRARPVVDGIDRVLSLAATWLGWDGRPRISEDGDRLYTPHKAIRRYADHLVDHLAEIGALLAGAATMPDGWHGSLVTLDADWARFTEADLNEATQRLRRLGQLYRLTLSSTAADDWERSRDPAWSIRAIVEHVADPWYAEQIGDLSGSANAGGRR
jgi:hypothetical protein